MEVCVAEILEDTLANTECGDEDSYIEIELDAAVPTRYNHDQNKGSCIDDDDDNEWKEYQLRISISSTISISLPDVQKESINVHTTVPRVAAIDDNVSFNPTVIQQIPQPDSQTKISSATRVIPCDNVDLLYTRKQPNLTTTTTTNGIMMKLLIKIRDIKIGALLASLVKPRQPCQVNNGHKSTKKYKTFFQCYQKELVTASNRKCKAKSRDQRRRSKPNDLRDDSICGSLRRSKKFNRVMEMDLGALRGIFNAMGVNIAQKRSISSKRGTRSSSCNATPIHEGFSPCSSDENSIHAAIAYCKSSLGQTSEFSFRSSFSSSPSQFVAYYD